MSDLSKENSNLPAKQGSIGSQLSLGVAGNWLYDNVLKKFVESLPFMISYIAWQTAWIKGLDWYWIALIVLGVLFASSFVIRTIFLVKDRRNQPTDQITSKPESDDLTSLTSINGNKAELEKKLIILEGQRQVALGEIESLKEDKIFYEKQHKSIKQELENKHQNEIESLKAERQKEIEQVKSGFEKALNESKKALEASDEREQLLSDNQWLINRAKEQSENISDYIILKRFFWYRDGKKPTPRMYLGVEIENKSLFDIVLDSHIDGYISLDGFGLREKKIEFDHNPFTIYSMNNPQTYTIKYLLSSEEYDYILETRKNGSDSISEGRKFIYEFEITNLIITFTGSEKFPNLPSGKLKISPHLRVINGEAYNPQN